MSVSAMAADPELMKEFLDDTTELLENLDNDFVELESDPGNEDLLNGIFRAVHTIKGTSSFLGFDQLVAMSHVTEDVLQMLRSHQRVVTQEVMDILLVALDNIKFLVNQIQNQDIKEVDLSEAMADLKRIQDGELGDPNATLPDAEVDDAPKSEASETESIVSEPAKTWKSAKKKSSQLDKLEKKVAKDWDSATIRVDVGRLDDLMNLVGELVLERNKLLQVNRDFRVNQEIDSYADKVAEITEKVHFVTGELQLSVLKTRMIPIDRLFRKFPRLVRDIARDMDKDVELEMLGGETELDKTVIDQLGDPLIHLLRNSIDHGVESEEERLTLGKDPKGKIQLSASQEGNHILIRVKDDGKGINVRGVKARALERKLASDAQIQMMSEQDLLQFIFEPGFSTAEKVSNISGRGVGMDVVKTNIRNLNGIIDIRSEMNVGTEIVLKLPLTLAVIQALMVEVSGDIYAIPLASVLETLRIQDEKIKFVDQKAVICHRDSVIPLVYLNRIFEKESKDVDDRDKHRYVVLIGLAEKRFGLVVDKPMGQEEVVIKSLGEYLGNVSGIAGGTITGDGRVRLIVDLAGIADLV